MHLCLILNNVRNSIIITDEHKVIGRSSSSDVRLPLPDVSRKHASIYTQEGNAFIVDHKSLNGTKVNDNNIPEYVPYEIKEGDTITIGGFRLTVRDTQDELVQQY